MHAFSQARAGASSHSRGVSGPSRVRPDTRTAAVRARALRERAELARMEASLAAMRASVQCALAFAAAGTMYDLLASMQEAAGRAPAFVGQQRQRLARQHRRDGQDCRRQAGPSGPATGILGTGSPDRVVSWAELEALAEQLSITVHAREPELPALREQLSHREIEVLRYLPSVLTAGEIGAELCVSVNAVKAHLRSIYRKLGVTRRRDAVVRAHHYGILEGPFPADPNPI